MAGVTPISITPPPPPPAHEPTHSPLGQNHTKPLDNDLEHQLGGMQGKHKPEPKHKPETKHKPELTHKPETKHKPEAKHPPAHA